MMQTLFQSIPPYWSVLKRQLVRRVGDVENDQALNERISPVYHAKHIKAPLLIAQGSNDPRVKKAESDQMVQSLRNIGRDVTYVVFPDEGHGFARPQNKMDFYSKCEMFLAKHLGGLYVPPHDPDLFEGTTAMME
jgi:dipeptidyl aminopeptidase/acylaminoacyl peptidase